MIPNRYRQSGTVLAEAFWSAWTQCIHLPLVVATSCWNMGVDMMWPDDVRDCRANGKRRLVVPQAEGDEEPTLFA